MKKKFFNLLFRLFSFGAKKCAQQTERINAKESLKKTLIFDAHAFVEQIQDPTINREHAHRVFRRCHHFGLSRMDLAIAFGWICARGTPANDALTTLSSYMEKNPKNRARRLILDHVIIQPGTI